MSAPLRAARRDRWLLNRPRAAALLGGCGTAGRGRYVSTVPRLQPADTESHRHLPDVTCAARAAALCGAYTRHPAHGARRARAAAGAAAKAATTATLFGRMWGWGGARGDCCDEGPTGGASERHKTNAKASARPAWATARLTPVFGCFPPSARAVRSRRFKLLCHARTAGSLHWYTEALISLIKLFVKQLCGCCPLGRTQKRPLTRTLAFGIVR